MKFVNTLINEITDLIVITFIKADYIKFIHIIHSTSLHVAAKKGNLEIVNLLMQVNGIDINVKDEI